MLSGSTLSLRHHTSYILALLSNPRPTEVSFVQLWILVGKALTHSLRANDSDNHYCFASFPGCRMGEALGSSVTASVWPGISAPAICDHAFRVGQPYSAVHRYSPVSSCQMWAWTLPEFASAPVHCRNIHAAEARVATVSSTIFASVDYLLENITKVQNPYFWIPSY